MTNSRSAAHQSFKYHRAKNLKFSIIGHLLLNQNRRSPGVLGEPDEMEPKKAWADPLRVSRKAAA